MKSRNLIGSHFSETRFGEVIHFFASDLPALVTAELGDNAMHNVIDECYKQAAIGL
jgi:hypothetical protein